MPTEWRGTVPDRYRGFLPGSNSQRKPQPFNSFDIHMVVNVDTGVAVNSENCAERAAQSAQTIYEHGKKNGYAVLYTVVTLPDYLVGKDSPQNWQRLLDANNS